MTINPVTVIRSPYVYETVSLCLLILSIRVFTVVFFLRSLTSVKTIKLFYLISTILLLILNVWNVSDEFYIFI